MTGVIDSFSRVVTGIEFHLAEPNAVDAAKALATAFLPKDDESNPFFGVAETVQTDNAQAYIGKMLNGLAFRAGFILENTPVGCPSANGKIERFFQTFQDGLLSRLAGYASQSNAKAKAETRGVVPWTVLQSVSRRFLLEYHSSVHSGIGTTPWEAWHENIGNSPGYFIPVSEIRRRMRIEVECEVTREGVTVLGANFSGKVLNGLVGDNVVVLCSPFGGDQSVEVFHHWQLIGRLIPRAAATSAINKARLDRKIEQATFRKEMRESLDACPPVDAPEIVSPKEERKRIRAAQNKPARRGKIHPVNLEIESDERKS